MDVSTLLDGLNEKQREAVAAPRSNMLVLAGAGSGKTRVLIHRIAWLIEVERTSPSAILAVTFTNKAAAEMRSRLANVLGDRSRGMWIGTFHGIAHRLLRAHHLEAKLPQDFQILDSDDQYRFIRRVLKFLNLDEKLWPVRGVMSYINGKKDEGLRPGDIDLYGDPVTRTYQQIYSTYQAGCDRAGLVDFAELLLRAHELWLKSPTILEHYRDRFQDILVDEFQDTNAIQYAWLRMLAGETGKVIIVGDDDQSIYGWRGAKVENIERFLTDYQDAQIIRLEQNYRSTATILKAANSVIANNSKRLGKELWTQSESGELISLYSAFNEIDEARFVVSRVKEWQRKGGKLADCAILYRSNAQSRVLEEALMQDAIPYRIYGGLRFFERQEIKDAMAYLRLTSNRDDDASFERVVNTPTRGIGDRTLEILRNTARDQRVTLWQSALYLVSQRVLTGRAGSAVTGFINLINELEESITLLPLHQQADVVIQQSGLKGMYLAEKGEKSQARVENLEELITACRQYQRPDELEDMSDLSAFLAHAALESGENQAEEESDAVQLMTLHSAKGLEFPLVVMVGVEEGMFPSQQSSEESGRLEEERRLCYVGMTRAMEKLYICYAESRRIYGREMFHKPSRFIREMPAECLEEIRLTTNVSRPVQHNRVPAWDSQQHLDSSALTLGQRVLHPKFGEGIVLNFEGAGQQSRVQIQFDEVGVKWLMAAYARLAAL